MSAAAVGECPRTIAIAIAVVFSLSSVVVVEPAPFDLACILLAALVALRLQPQWHPDLMLPIATLSAFALFNFISAMFATDAIVMTLFMAVTFFLIFVAVLICAIVTTWPNAAHAVLGGYCISSVMTTGITLAVVAGLLPFQIVMFDESRIQGFFKDPNVYGPSLVIPVLYLLSLLEQEAGRIGRSLLIGTSLLALVLGIVFAASRAAWMNMALSLVLFVGLRMWESRGSGAVRFWLMAAGVGALVAGATFGVITLTGYDSFMSERAGMQNYDADRFGAQRDGLEMALREPLGQGPGQFEVRVGVIIVGAHSLYVRTMLENGLGGLFALVLFLCLTLLAAFRSALLGGPLAPAGAVIAASMAGALVNGVFVDTLHWRSLWIQAGLAWGLYAVCLQPTAWSVSGSLVPGRSSGRVR
jgi:hypothetical protein